MLIFGPPASDFVSATFLGCANHRSGFTIH